MTVIKIDIDGTRPDVVFERLEMLIRHMEWKRQAVMIHRTRHGYHVVIYLAGRELPPAVIVAVQAILGSDWKREIFNLVRVRQLDRVPKFWRNRWNVLYTEHHRGL